MSWRLVSDLVAYIVHKPGGKGEIYFAAPEKKSYLAEVVRQLPDFPYTEVRLEQNEFKIRLSENLELLVTGPELPSTYDWYKVGNFSYTSIRGRENLGSIITQVANNCGDFGETIFEVAFSDDVPGEVKLVSPKMSEYKGCMEEMKRRLNCEIYKKTKKWIPGHRYDSLKETIYYLGELKSRRTDPLSSQFVGPDEMVTVYLYTTEIPEGAKTVTDILKKECFGKNPGNLKVLTKIPLMVDSGEVVKNDMPADISTLWPDILDNSIKRYTSIGWTGYSVIIHIKETLDFLCYQSPGHTEYNLSDEDKNKIKDVFKSSVFDVVMRNWDIKKGREELNILSTNTEEQNIESTKKVYFQSFVDGNVLRNIYYPGLYQEIFKEDFGELVLEVLKGWSPDIITKNFENYTKFSQFLISHWKDKTALVSKQRINSTNYRLDIVTIADLLGEGTVLYNYICEIIGSIRENHGIGANEYSVSNVGTRQNPKIYETISLTVKEILDYYNKKGVEVPEILKNEIVKRKFWKLSLTIDIDGGLK